MSDEDSVYSQVDDNARKSMEGEISSSLYPTSDHIRGAAPLLSAFETQRLPSTSLGGPYESSLPGLSYYEDERDQQLVVSKAAGGPHSTVGFKADRPKSRSARDSNTNSLNSHRY